MSESNAATHYYPPGPVSREFINADDFIVGIMGPIGSGKSVSCVMKLIRNCQKQMPDKNGWRKRRTAVVRNTQPELRTTTIKTWHAWVPSTLGKWRENGPPSHHIIDHANKIDWEILFIALDRPDDVKKCLSLELSDAWINEAREIPKAIVDALTGRVGRYPARDGAFQCTDPQILMDTNAPDADHWWYVLAERDMSNENNRLMHETTDDIEKDLHEKGILRPGQKLIRFLRQPGANQPGAENLENLPPGYYEKAKAGKSKEWIKVYIDALYGFVMDGKPMYPEYVDSVHCVPFELPDRVGLEIGFDWGLTPAAAFGGRMPNGQLRIRSEVVSHDMGIITFGKLVKQHIQKQYPTHKIIALTGDPSGNIRGGDEKTPFMLMKSAEVGLEVLPARGNNDPTMRREALSKPMRTMIDGEPGILIHPECNFLRKGLSGGYNLRRIMVAGDAKYRDKPDKNIYSHICEAAEYFGLGSGEGVELIKQYQQKPRQQTAIDDYNILG